MNDERKAICPHCGKELAKIPSRKTKCPHCGNYMFVRTRPENRVRVLVTESEAQRIDAEWSVMTSSDDWQYISRTYEFYTVRDREVQKEKSRLKAQCGFDRSDNDIRWSLFNKKLLEFAKSYDWGLYRNTIFEMAEQLRQENRHKEALRHFFQVCYLDLNGPVNCGNVTNPDLLKTYPPFDPNLGCLAPAVIALVKHLINTLKLNKEEAKDIYIEIGMRIERNLRLPLSAEKCWSILEKEIWKE
jgi:DNA-directed RNA polymerase subunit RPC12/RpoP